MLLLDDLHFKCQSLSGMKMFLWEGESTHVLITKGKHDIRKTSCLEKTKSGTTDEINAQFKCLIFSHNEYNVTDHTGKDKSMNRWFRRAIKSKQKSS